MDRFTKFKTAILGSAIVTASLPAIALASISEGDTLGTTEADVRAALEAAGYTVMEIEVEDGKIEAEVTREGEAFEVEISARSGAVLEIETEDDED